MYEVEFDWWTERLEDWRRLDCYEGKKMKRIMDEIWHWYLAYRPACEIIYIIYLILLGKKIEGNRQAGKQGKNMAMLKVLKFLLVEEGGASTGGHGGRGEPRHWK